MRKVIHNKHKNYHEIILNREKHCNALDYEILCELNQIFAKIKIDNSTKCLLFRGQGNNFCSGADLNWFHQVKESNNAQNKLSLLAKTLQNLRKLPQVTLCHVNGNIMGGGIGLALSCNIVIAEKESLFSTPEIKIGLVPAIILPYVVNAIGKRRALEMFLTARKIRTPEAKELGLIHEIGSLGFAVEYLKSLTGTLEHTSTDIINKIKTMVNAYNYSGTQNNSVEDLYHAISVSLQRNN